MGERKVLNKYYPPDFDPRLLPRNKKPIDEQIKVRTMLPFTIQCDACKEFIYRGRKFNSRKELVQGEEYLGIKIWRFYVRCTRCNAEIAFKTDPKNGSYVCEMGAKQYYEKAQELYDDVLEEDQRAELEENSSKDPFAMLETRQQESKKEMEEMEALEELREISERKVKLTYEELIKSHEEIHAEKRKEHELEDELLVQRIFGKKIKPNEDDQDAEDEPKSLPLLKTVDDSKLEESVSLFSAPALGKVTPSLSKNKSSVSALKTRIKIKPKTAL
jgi:hypothetical protein